MLVRFARSESRRRAHTLNVLGPEIDDIAFQAAADALVLILAKIAEFRGESRLSTWAYKFVVFEVSSKINRHYWARSGVAMGHEEWDGLPSRLGMDPAAHTEARELIAAVRSAVDEELTDRQRHVFVALVVRGTPLDVVAQDMQSSRNAIYKVMFDARRKVRAVLVTAGFLAAVEPSARPDET